MSRTGVKLQLLMGENSPTPATLPIVEALENVSVTHKEREISGFQITFIGDRSGAKGKKEYLLLKEPQLKMFNRVRMIVLFHAASPRVLIDGIITNIQLATGEGQEVDHIVVTGMDLGFMLDLKEVNQEHPGQSEEIIAQKIIGNYAQYDLTPEVIPPPASKTPLVTERIPVQRGTDWQYLQEMAARFGYVFYIKSGPEIGVNKAYWGPPKRGEPPQSALSANMGPDTNVESLSFSDDRPNPALVEALIQDRESNEIVPVKTNDTKRDPLLAQKQSLKTDKDHVRQRLLDHLNGLTTVEAQARAQGVTDFSVDQVVTASGTLDTGKYGKLLQTYGVVGVRGVGERHDGLYFVNEVKHHIRKGAYQQSFRLSREGTDPLTQTLKP